jgi:malonyl-CoA/methylmalonyl-CoA synthetase
VWLCVAGDEGILNRYSGNAQLPIPNSQQRSSWQCVTRWREITGHTLLDRYGMTEIGIVEQGSYRLFGRTAVDIIKTGGFKVSAIEIEEVLRRHPAIAGCAVVGVSDQEWGERVAAAVDLGAGATLSLAELQLWAKEHLAPYNVPRALHVVDTIPRNAMGKVVKPDRDQWVSA